MSEPPRILFQSRNRRGLGHLMRAVNLARELRELAPRARVAIHAVNPSARTYAGPHAECVVAGDGGESWPAFARRFAPDVVVYDTMLPADPAAEVPARRVYVMRKTKPDRRRMILSDPFMDTVDLALVPHERAEFGGPLPPDLDRRTVFCGPIVRPLEPAAQARLALDHGLPGAGLVLVSAAGGGGFAETAEPFFAAVWAAHALLVPNVPGLRHVVVLGPHGPAGAAPLPGMHVVREEPDLGTLFSLADLVVGEGGYNSVAELRLARTPAVFLPGARRYDDQLERVRALAMRGQAVVARGGTERAAACIAAVAGDADRRAAMRAACAADELVPGNRRGAAAILTLVRERAAPRPPAPARA